MITALKYAQYFLIATIGGALAVEKMPETAWEWWRFSGGALMAGLIAMKALQSETR